MTVLNKRFKVLFLATWYPNRLDPMFGLFVKKHALSILPHCDVAVLFICTDPHLKKNSIEVVVETEDNIPTVRVYYKSSLNPLTKAYRYVKSMVLGYKKIKNEFGKPEVIHQHVLTRFGILALFLKLFHRIPFIITEHWSRYLPINIEKGAYSGIFRQLLTRMVVRNAAAVTTVTENLKKAMLAVGLKNNYYIIPNAVDVNLFSPELKKTAVEIKKIVHISCFEEVSKNVKGILNAINTVYKQRQDFVLHLIGEGVDHQEAVKHASKLGLTNRQVIFEGLKLNGELIRHIREADFLLLFSNYENLPCVILESMACSVPVISTDVGGISEHVNSDFGLLIPAKNEEKLISAINHMLDNHSGYDRQKMRNYTIENFSNEAVGLQFYKIYSEVLK